MISPSDQFNRRLVAFTRYYTMHINPVLHRTEYRGRTYPDSEIMVMMALSMKAPQSPTQICRNVGMQKGSLTSVLRRLDRAGFINRRGNPGDERSYVAELTAEGAAFVAHLDRQRREGFRALFGTMTAEDMTAAADGLGLIAAQLAKLEETKMTVAEAHDGAHLHWYQAASPEDRREYDLFGPWINEVKTEADVPRRFRTYYPEHKGARFLLKIPRNADRREVRPGMDLYLAMVAIHEGGVSFMELKDGQVGKRDLAWNQVAATGSFGDKLLGTWTLYLTDGTRFGFDYNKVSSDLMDQVTDFIRARLAPPQDKKAPASQSAVALSDDDLFFGSALMEVRRRGPEPMVPIHFEPQGRPCRNDEGERAVSTGLLILDAPEELILLNRDKPARLPDEAWLAANDIFIPYRALTGFSLAAPAEASQGQFLQLLLHLGKQTITQPCLAIPQVAMETLKARGVAQV